jgi:hypothetical protein
MLAIFAVALALLDRSHPLRLPWRLAAAWTVVGAAIAAVLIVVSGNYGTGTLFYHSIVAFLPYPADGPPALPLAEVVRLYAYTVANIWATVVPLFVLLGLLAAWLRARVGDGLRRDPAAVAALGLVATIAIGYLMFPWEIGRLLAMPFIGCTLLLVLAAAAVARRPAGASIVA